MKKVIITFLLLTGLSATFLLGRITSEDNVPSATATQSKSANTVESGSDCRQTVFDGLIIIQDLDRALKGLDTDNILLNMSDRITQFELDVQKCDPSIVIRD